MVSEGRQRVLETNKSLRSIKNELENLLEKGVITDTAFDSIHALLPAESSLSGSTSAAAPTQPPRTKSAASPTTAFGNLHLSNTAHKDPAPPAYSSTGPPALPARNNPAASPPPPTKPVLCKARALYRYAAGDARDCSFEKDDRLLVHEYMNADWWMGRNERTGQEGIFPKSYVEPESEKAAYPGPGAVGAGVGGNYPTPPGRTNPYDSSVPPMGVANGGGGSGGNEGDRKPGEYGKKFGKKLGNAAVFGAGATLGGKIVNSIF